MQLKVIGYFRVDLGVTPGGAERQIFHLMHYLSINSDIKVEACVGDFGQNSKIQQGNMVLWRSCALEGNIVLRAWTLLRTLKKIDADLYVFRSPDLGVAMGALMVKLLNRKVFYMVANEDEAIPERLIQICGRIGEKSMSWLYRKANLLTVQTQSQANAFEQHRGLKPAAIVPNMYWEKEKGDDAERDQNVEVEDRECVLWVGRCDLIKRCELFLEMAERFSSHKFVMICPQTNHSEYWELTRNRAHKIHNLEFIEGVKPDEVSLYYRKAKLLVMTSVSEGFSNVMMEALYAKCPLLTLNVNPDNIIPRFNLGKTFLDDQMEIFYETFEKLISNPILLRQMGEAGRKYIEEHHSVENTGKRFLELVLSLK